MPMPERSASNYRRAILKEADLRRMAKVVLDLGVTFRGHVDPLGGFSFSIAPVCERANDDGDDLDDRLEAFGSR